MGIVTIFNVKAKFLEITYIINMMSCTVSSDKNHHRLSNFDHRCRQCPFDNFKAEIKPCFLSDNAQDQSNNHNHNALNRFATFFCLCHFTSPLYKLFKTAFCTALIHALFLGLCLLDLYRQASFLV